MRVYFCGPQSPGERRWEDKGGTVSLRAGNVVEDHAYEITEGGKRLRLEPPVAAFARASGATVNSYEREADAPIAACPEN